MAYREIIHDNKKYFTFYKLTEIKVGQTIFLYVKVLDSIIKTKCISIPENLSTITMLFGNEEFLFETDDNKIISVSKRYDNSVFFYMTIPKQKTSRHKVSKVVFLSDKPHVYKHHKNKTLIGLSEHRKLVLSKMCAGIKYTPSDLGSNIISLLRMKKDGYVIEVASKPTKNKISNRLFMKNRF